MGFSVQDKPTVNQKPIDRGYRSAAGPVRHSAWRARGPGGPPAGSGSGSEAGAYDGPFVSSLIPALEVHRRVAAIKTPRASSHRGLPWVTRIVVSKFEFICSLKPRNRAGRPGKCPPVTTRGLGRPSDLRKLTELPCWYRDVGVPVVDDQAMQTLTRAATIQGIKPITGEHGRESRAPRMPVIVGEHCAAGRRFDVL